MARKRSGLRPEVSKVEAVSIDRPVSRFGNFFDWKNLIYASVSLGLPFRRTPLDPRLARIPEFRICTVYSIY